MHLPRRIRVIHVQANLAGIRQKLLKRIITARTRTITHDSAATRRQHATEILNHRLTGRTSQETHHITRTHQQLKTILRRSLTLNAQHLRQIHQIGSNPRSIRADAARLLNQLRINIHTRHTVTQRVQLLTHTTRTRTRIKNLRATRSQRIHQTRLTRHIITLSLHRLKTVNVPLRMIRVALLTDQPQGLLTLARSVETHHCHKNSLDRVEDAPTATRHGDRGI